VLVLTDTKQEDKPLDQGQIDYGEPIVVNSTSAQKDLYIEHLEHEVEFLKSEVTFLRTFAQPKIEVAQEELVSLSAEERRPIRRKEKWSDVAARARVAINDRRTAIKDKKPNSELEDIDGTN
jgi:hypothetical protein